MKQISFSDFEFSGKKKVTRRERFLGDLDRLIPWSLLIGLIKPHYPKGDGRGRPPIELESMLRMYVVQIVQGLSDEGVEDAVYENLTIRRFVGIDLARKDAPDATTLLHFRHLLEQHDLAQKIFETINGELERQGLLLRQGTIVDATIIAAPPSTKNRSGRRDEEMHQTKKGNEWHFGMKGHIGVDASSGIVHTLVTTAANVADVTQAAELLHGQEEVVYADAGYTGVEKREENAGKAVEWHIAMRRSKLAKMAEGPLKEIQTKLEHAKASIRAHVEHPFHTIKNLFHHRKTRYRGLAKNTAQLYVMFAMANLLRVKGKLLEA